MGPEELTVDFLKEVEAVSAVNLQEFYTFQKLLGQNSKLSDDVYRIAKVSVGLPEAMQLRVYDASNPLAPSDRVSLDAAGYLNHSPIWPSTLGNFWPGLSCCLKPVPAVFLKYGVAHPESMLTADFLILTTPEKKKMFPMGVRPFQVFYLKKMDLTTTPAAGADIPATLFVDNDSGDHVSISPYQPVPAVPLGASNLRVQALVDLDWQLQPNLVLLKAKADWPESMFEDGSYGSSVVLALDAVVATATGDELTAVWQLRNDCPAEPPPLHVRRNFLKRTLDIIERFMFSDELDPNHPFVDQIWDAITHLKTELSTLQNISRWGRSDDGDDVVSACVPQLLKVTSRGCREEVAWFDDAVRQGKDFLKSLGKLGLGSIVLLSNEAGTRAKTHHNLRVNDDEYVIVCTEFKPIVDLVVDLEGMAGDGQVQVSTVLSGELEHKYTFSMEDLQNLRLVPASTLASSLPLTEHRQLVTRRCRGTTKERTLCKRRTYSCYTLARNDDADRVEQLVPLCFQHVGQIVEIVQS